MICLFPQGEQALRQFVFSRRVAACGSSAYDYGAQSEAAGLLQGLRREAVSKRWRISRRVG
jgi:hypothetical protein